MDGFVRLPIDQKDATPADISSGCRQRTLKAAINCVGIGVHSGRRVTVTIRPAAADHGIVFHRTDLNRVIAAHFDNVADTRLCTVLADPAMASARIGTVEHLMAALSGLAIDNALIEVDGPEIPILDGSAAPFVFLLDCAGSVELDAPRRVFEICRPVRVHLRRILGRTPATWFGNPRDAAGFGNGLVDRFCRQRDRPPIGILAADAGQLPQ